MFSREEKILLFILSSIQFANIVDFMIMMPLGPQFMRLFEISPHEFGLLVSAYTFSASIMAVLAAFFSDLYDRKKMLLVFFLGFALSTVFCALSPTYWTLLIARIVTGAFGGVLSSLVLAIVGDVISPERRGTAMGVVMMAFSVASVVGVPFSLAIANKFSWHAPFIFLATVSFLLMPVIVAKVPPIVKHLETKPTATPIRSFVNILKDKNILLSLFFMFCLVMGQFTVIPFISPTLVANAGMTEAQLPLIYLVGGAFTIFSSPLIGRLADKYGKKIIFYYGVVLSLIPIYLVTHLKPSPLYFILPISAALFVAMGGRMIPAMALVTSTVTARNRGSFMSINSAVQQFSCAVASYVSGLILVKTEGGQLENYDLVGFIAISFSFIAIFLVNKIRTVE